MTWLHNGGSAVPFILEQGFPIMFRNSNQIGKELHHTGHCTKEQICTILGRTPKNIYAPCWAGHQVHPTVPFILSLRRITALCLHQNWFLGLIGCSIGFCVYMHNPPFKEGELSLLPVGGDCVYVQSSCRELTDLIAAISLEFVFPCFLFTKTILKVYRDLVRFC